jgi:IMP dehydrogenase/GMP reductase
MHKKRPSKEMYIRVCEPISYYTMAFHKLASTDIKLDFKDVLIVPKRSSVSSRSIVDLRKSFAYNTPRKTTKWTGVPIISSNMDTVSNLETFDALKEQGYLTCFPKHYNEDWISSVPNQLQFTNDYMLSCGVHEHDYTKLMHLMEAINHTFNKDVKFVCVDVANGYLQSVVEVCRMLRNTYPHLVIVAGNVVTPEGVEALIKEGGANIVKCGIGCFAGDTKVLMSDGFYKNIKDIEPGECVINGHGKPVKVLNKVSKGVKPVLRVTTDVWHEETRVTSEHLYLVFDNEEGQMQWRKIGECQEEMDNTLVPENIDYHMLTSYMVRKAGNNLTGGRRGYIRSGYQLGYLMGQCITHGHIPEKTKDYSFVLSYNIKQDEQFRKTRKMLQTIFGIDYFTTYDECMNLYVDTSYLDPILHHCIQHRGKSDSILCSNRSFVKGMHDGLSSRELEIYNWCVLNLKIGLDGKPLEQKGQFNMANVLKVEDKEEEEEVWDIEVDCPSHSFIANNCIVHNSGSVCTTRLKTGVGYPQLSTILECAPVAHSLGGHIISDGGIVHVGDIAKAFGAGADYVMLGSMLAGHTESPGELILDPKTNKWFKSFYGMASETAVKKYNSGMKNYRTAEGKVVKVMHKGPISTTLRDINGGLRSACTYTNSMNLFELEKNTEFVLVSQQHNTLFS